MESLVFQDRFGTEWDLSIDMHKAEIIDKSDYSAVTSVKFCFIKPEKEFFSEVFANRSLAGALAWTIIQDDQLHKFKSRLPEGKQVEDLSADELQVLFLRGLNGTALRDMHRIIMKAVADFFPELQTVLSKLISKMEIVQERMRTELESMDEEVDTLLNEELDTVIQQMKKELPSKLREQRGKTTGLHSVS